MNDERLWFLLIMTIIPKIGMICSLHVDGEHNEGIHRWPFTLIYGRRQVGTCDVCRSRLPMAKVKR